MVLMMLGLVGIIGASFSAYLLRRHQEILRLQSEVFRARAALDEALDRRRELAETWCSLCEEKGAMPQHTPALRKSLRTILQLDQEEAESDMSSFRLEEEKKLGQLVHSAYVAFLQQMEGDGPHREFFQKYFISLTSLEKDIWDAHRMHNELVDVFNRRLRGIGGFLFRRWEKLAPQTPLPVAGGAKPSWKTSDKISIPS